MGRHFSLTGRCVRLVARLLSSAMLAGIASALAPTSPALAACVLTGTPPALVTITCGNTTTDGTTVTTSPNAGTNASTYNIGANVNGIIGAGSTVTGQTLAIASTLLNGSVSFVNNGTVTSSPSGGQILTITGNGGGASYSGSGSINGTIANSQSLAVFDNTPTAGLVSVNMTGGSLTSTGNTVQAMQVASAGTGGINVTTAAGTSILLVDTASGSSNRGMYVNNNGTAGDIVINSGSSITGNAGAASLGNIFAIDTNQSAPGGNINVTSSGVIDVTRAADKCCTGIMMTNQTTSGNITAIVNANITGSLAGAGVFAQFNNPANTGTGNITIANGVAVSAGIGVAIDGGSNGNHQISIGSGASVTSRNAAGVRVNGVTSNLTLINAGAISSLTADGVSVTGNVMLNMTGGSIGAGPGAFSGIAAGGNISGTNAGTITGNTGITTAASGSNLINAGTITGTGGTAILFVGAGNTLTLHDGTNITGAVNGGTNATFQLGGTTGTPTFNASGLGAQYTNFSTFNKIDAGQWTLSGTGAQTWNVSGGTLTGTTTSASGNKLMSNNANFAFDQNVAGAYSGVISGAGNLIKNGTGAVTLGVAQTYSGTTTINAGSLVLGGSNFVPAGTALAVNSPGTFDLNNFNQTVGDLSGSGAIALGTGTLTAGGAGSTAFSGAIGGGGALIKAGAGTLSLTGTNNYTGGTTITAGILQLGNGGAGGSIVGDVTNNSILAVNRSDTFTYAGVISGNGAFQQNGTGTTIFTGAHTYLGGTTINAGTLQLGNGGTIGSIVGNVLNNGTFAINHSDAVTFGNAVSGTGSFVQNGTGTTTFTNTNTYTGGTTIAAGTLQLGNGGATGSIVGNVLNNATFAINHSDAVTLGGVISGTGAFQQNGAGSTNLTATNNYAGATTVNAGTLFVNGSIASSSGLTVNAGATVGGIGALPTTVINGGGKLSPGNSIGTIAITGNLSFVGAGNYIVEVSPSNADRTNVTGSASLAGTIQFLPQPGSYTVGTKYTLLNATGGVSGTFGTTDFTSGFGGSVKPHIEYDANNVFLVLDPNSISPFLVNATRNQRAVAGAIDASLQSGNVPPLFLGLFNLTIAQLPGALDQLSGEVHASTAGVLVDESLYARSAVLGRLRQASYGGDSRMASLAMGGPQAFQNGEELNSALAYGKSPIVMKAPAMASQPSYDVVYWAQGFGARGRFDGDGNAARLQRDLTGFFSGVDTSVGGNGRLGIAAGYTGSRNNLDGRGVSNVETGHFSGYGGWSFGAFNVRAGGAYAFHTIDTDRTIAFSGFFDRATAHYNGRTGQVFGEAGYGFAFGKVAIEPFAGGAWVHLKTDGFTERAAVAGLAGAANAFEVGYSTLGVRAASIIPVGSDITLVPRGSVAWQHAFNDVTPEARLAFVVAPGPFVIAGVPIARDSVLGEAGLDLNIGHHATVGVSYTGQVARNVQDHAAKGKFSWKF